MKVNEVITNRIIEGLEKGNIPWHKPWAETGFPKNLVSKKAYRGMNVLMLTLANRPSPWWVTFKQAKELGGEVKKGEKGMPVIFWKVLEYDNLDPESSKIVDQIPFLRYYTVFNVEQCEGLEGKIPVAVVRNNTPLEVCEEVIQKYTNKPAIETASIASYSSSLDRVNIPPLKSFDSADFYYATLFHEFVHSTGHKSRLDRCTITDCKPFGSADYSKEELVAEIGASFLIGYTGIEAEKLFDNTQAYINHWIQNLKNDPTFILQASAMAQKAYDHILKIEEVKKDE